MGIDLLATAIFEEPRPPCEGCNFFDMCRLNRLACNDFQTYASIGGQIGKPRKPSRKVYNDIYHDFVEYSETRHGQ